MPLIKTGQPEYLLERRDRRAGQRGDLIRKFFRTVAIVTVFSTAEKCLGFLYRIFLSRTIGSEGVGLYQIALSVFAVLLTVSCSGTPITVSRLMTKYKARNQSAREGKVITAGLLATLVVSVILFLVFFFGAPAFSFLFTDERCLPIFRIILPGLIVTSLYAVLRGVFWGNKDFLSYSIIELLEEACMILVGIFLISGATDIFEGAYGAGVAVLVSYLFSFTLAAVVFFVKGGRFRNPKSELKPLLSSAVPITAMRTASSLINSLVAILLPMRLVAAGMTNSEALSAFGAAFGMAMPLLFVPSTLLGSFSLVLVPEISENFYREKHEALKADIEKALKACLFVSSLFVPAFFVLGEELGVLIFNSYEGGIYLGHSAYLMFLMSISNISTSILNSMGFETNTLRYFLISAAIMLACIWFLPAAIGVYALLVGFTFVFGLTALFNMRLLNRKSKLPLQYRKFMLVSFLSLLPTALLGVLLKNLLLDVMGNFLTVLVVGGVCVAFQFLFYLVFAREDLKWILEKLSRKKRAKRASAQPTIGTKI